jgi:hypothetical protein
MKLRRRSLLVIAFAAAACSCSQGPVWEPRLEGRIVDEETGEPVVGVLVEASYTRVDPGLFHASIREVPQGWAYSDPDGRFVIPGKWKVQLAGSWSATPSITTYHPDYDWNFDELPGGPLPRWHGFTIRIRNRDEYSPLEHERRAPGSACHFSEATCLEFCRMAFPGVEDCGRW